MVRSRVSFLAACLLVLASAAQAQLPEWARSGKSNKFPDDFYWVSVASAMGSEGVEKAKEQARVGIASQLKVTVSSKMKYVQSEKMIGDVSNYSTDLLSETQSVVEKQQLPGLQFVETFVNPVDTRSYVLAVLEKEQFLNGLLREIAVPVRELETKLSNARALAHSADLGEAVNSYASIMAAVPDLYPKIVFYNTLSPKAYELPSGLVYDNIEFELTKILSAVTLTIKSGNAQKVVLGKPFDAPLVVAAAITMSGKTLPLKGVAVAYQTGKTSEQVIPTDANGIASCAPIVSSDLLTDDTHGRLPVAVDIPHMSPRLRAKVAQNTGVAFAFVAEMKQITVRVEVAGGGSDPVRFELAKRVVKALEKNNVRVNMRDSRFELTLVVTSHEAQSVSGMGAALHVVNVDVTGILKNVETGTTVGTVSTSAKGVDQDVRVAERKGIAAAEFDGTELSAIIARARE